MYELLRLQKSKPKTLFTPPSSSSSSSSSPSLFTSAANPAESHSIVRSAGRSTIDVDPSNRELQQSHSRGLHFCKATATNSVQKTLISCKKLSCHMKWQQQWWFCFVPSAWQSLRTHLSVDTHLSGLRIIGYRKAIL
jgi:hypothetical protein